MRSPLSKAARRILAYLASNSPVSPVSSSSRHLAEALKLSRSTVQLSLSRLNDLGCLKTLTGSPTRSSLHEVQPIALVPPYGGPIFSDPVENQRDVARNQATPRGPSSSENPQPPGPILCKTDPVFHTASFIRARDTYTSPTLVKPVSESTVTGAQWKSGELAQIVAGVFEREKLDWQLARKFETLAVTLKLPPGFVTSFVIEKYLEKRRSRYDLRTPGALYDFVAEDLPLWASSDFGRKGIGYWRSFTMPEDAPPRAMEVELHGPAYDPVRVVEQMKANGGFR